MSRMTAASADPGRRCDSPDAPTVGDPNAIDGILHVEVDSVRPTLRHFEAIDELSGDPGPNGVEPET